MKKIVLVLLIMFIPLTITSCGQSYSEDDIDKFLNRMDYERYIEINIHVLAVYTDDSDEDNAWPNTDTEYIISVDSADLFMSLIYTNYPDHGFESSNLVYELNSDDTLTRYMLDNSFNITDEYSSSIENISNTELLTILLDDFIPNFKPLEDIELSHISTNTYSFNLMYDDMLSMYPNVLSVMYATRALGFYHQSKYIFTYTFEDGMLNIQLEALYETEYVSQDFKMIFTISYPKSIEKIDVI